MYHENVASIASRWKHQVDTLGQRIESEKEKQKFYTGQINAKKVSFQKLNAELKEKRNACYESRSTLKTFEDSRIELTNTMAHLERQLYLQQKNNKIDQERLEEVYGEILSGVDNLMERAKNCVPQGQLVDLKMKIAELEKKQAIAKDLCNQNRMQLAMRKAQLSSVLKSEQSMQQRMSKPPKAQANVYDENSDDQEFEVMNKRASWMGLFDEKKIPDNWQNQEINPSAENWVDQTSLNKKVARVTGIVQPMRSLRVEDNDQRSSSFGK